MINEKSNKDTTITFRISLDTKKKLEQMAAKESRSLSNYITLLLEKNIKEKK